MTTTLTERQALVLHAVTTAITTRGYPPSLREIGDATGLVSVSSVVHQLKSLEVLGLIRRGDGTVRAIEVLDPQLRMSAAVSILEGLAAEGSFSDRCAEALHALKGEAS